MNMYLHQSGAIVISIFAYYKLISEMDLSKLKKRPSYPIETIAVAISFSPRCKPILAEAKRINDALKAHLVLIHIGEKSNEKENALDTMLTEVGIKANDCRIIFMEGEPVDTILKLCKLNIVDLLILGALEKENIFKFYLGSIARSISRKAKCSVLLLTNPIEQAMQYKKIVVTGVENPKTIHTIKTSLYFAKHLRVKNVTIVNEVNMPGLAMTIAEDSTAPQSKEIKKNIIDESSERLQSILNFCEIGDIKLVEKNITGKPGYVISKYARDKKADLLVINSPDTHLNLFDRIFAHDIEYILADLPCNVLIVHSRI
jgi:nucleotide-binding universal stress UspA family protein